MIEAGLPGVTLLETAPLGENVWKSWHFLFNTIPGLTGRIDRGAGAILPELVLAPEGSRSAGIFGIGHLGIREDLHLLEA